MKVIIISCVVIFIAVLFSVYYYLKGSNHFGAAFTDAPEISVSELVLNPAKYTGKRISVSGTVVDQCPSTGCFFYLEENGRRLRIELGDLGVTLPQKSGSKVRVEGQIVVIADKIEFLGTSVRFE